MTRAPRCVQTRGDTRTLRCVWRNFLRDRLARPIRRKGDKMKHLFYLTIILLAITATLLFACTGATGPGAAGCGGGLCVRLQLEHPIRLNEPVTVTITVQTQEDVTGLIVTLAYLPYLPMVIEGERQWTVDVQAHRQTTVNTTVRFTEEGNYELYADAHDTHKGFVVSDSQRVHVTRAGATINPPSPKTPPVAITLAVPPPFRTPTATPVVPTPTRQPYP